MRIAVFIERFTLRLISKLLVESLDRHLGMADDLNGTSSTKLLGVASEMGMK